MRIRIQEEFSCKINFIQDLEDARNDIFLHMIKELGVNKEFLKKKLMMALLGDSKRKKFEFYSAVRIKN